MAKRSATLKVLYVHHSSVTGGAERSLLELAGAVRDEGVDPVVVLPGEGPLADLMAEAGIETRFVAMTRLKRTINPYRIAAYLRSLSRGSRRIAEVAKDVGARLIHSNSTVAHLYGGEAASRLDLPAIWHVRDVIPLGALASRMARTATRLVAISDFIGRYIESEGIDAASVRVIPNGIDLGHIPSREDAARLRAEAREELGIDDDSPVVGTVAAIVPWKHPEDFVTAFARMLELEPKLHGDDAVHIASHKPLRGLHVGSDLTGSHPDLERRIRERAETVGGRRIVMPGWRGDPMRMFAAMDVYVATSRGEPFGRATVEAMASGLPVVAPDSGAHPEIVTHGETGLIAAEDPSGLAAAAIELLAEPDRARRMGEAGRARAAELFDIRRTAGSLAEMYREILSAG